MQKIKKDDKIIVRSGKDKGRIGRVLEVMPTSKKRPELGMMIKVEGINVKKKHVKPNPQKEQPGGIVPKEAFFPACKAALLDPTTNKASRVGIRELADGKKVRYFKSSNEVVDV